MSFHVDIPPSFNENLLSPLTLPSADVTLTPKQFASGIFIMDPFLERVITLPSAADLVAFEGAALKVGHGRKFYVRNDGSSAITIAMGAGGTLNGSGTAAIGTFASHFYIRFTNVTAGTEAYVVIRI